MDSTSAIGFSPYASESPWLRERSRMQADQVGAQMGATPPPQEVQPQLQQPPQDQVSLSPEAVQQAGGPSQSDDGMRAFVGMLREIYSERVGDKSAVPEAKESEGMKLPKNVQAPVESIEVMRPTQSWDQPKNRLEGRQQQQATGAAPEDRTDFSPEAASIQAPRPIQPAQPAQASQPTSIGVSPQRGVSPGEIFGGRGAFSGRAA